MEASVSKKDFLETKLETIVSKDELRPALTCVYFKDGYAYATDAHIAIKQSLKEVHDLPQDVIEALDGKLIDAESIKLMRGQKFYVVTEDGITAHSGTRKTTYHFMDEKYPDIEVIFPSTDMIDRKYNVKVNPFLLDRLAKVMPGAKEDGVLLHFHTGYKAILVTTSEHTREEQIGVVTPMTITERDNG